MSGSRSPMAITMGDPAGVGPEIVVKSLGESIIDRPCVVLGDPLVMANALEVAGSKLSLRILDTVENMIVRSDALNVLATSSLPELPEAGTTSAAAGRAAFDAIARAIQLAMQGEVAGMVTAPINKQALAAAGVPYPGHTEMLADHCAVERVAMMLANDELRTVLVTCHCSLREAIEQADLQAQRSAIALAHQALRAIGIASPRVAVAGLNPHAGESGLFGDEEIRIIAPAIEAARAEGIDASGPWPGDTVFMQARAGRFDVVVAQYHDQGLIPVKYLGLEKGVNITLGLPIIRTSPDHGTAFDIAGRGIADPSSLVSALKYAESMAQVRENSGR